MVSITGKTRICAVIGNPIEHSLSPAIHNIAFKTKGLDFAYVAFQVEDIGPAMDGFRAAKNLMGLSVTIPHKVSIIPHLDELDELAQVTGSVNTVVRQGDKLIGYTTDGEAVVRALQGRGIKLGDSGVVILGSGGAARAIAFAIAMRMKPKGINILGVIEEEIRCLVDDIARKTGISACGEIFKEDLLEDCFEKCSLAIHCTPVGMHPNVEESILSKDHLNKKPVVFDIVYNPLETKLLKEARLAGCEVIPGIEMFVNQAAMQFELWTGQKAPVEVMRKVVEESLVS